MLTGVTVANDEPAAYVSFSPVLKKWSFTLKTFVVKFNDAAGSNVFWNIGVPSWFTLKAVLSTLLPFLALYAEVITSSLIDPYDKTSGKLTKSLSVWIISLWVWTVTFDTPASGKNLIFRFDPLNSDPNVPIPVVFPVPTGKNGYWVI